MGLGRADTARTEAVMDMTADAVRRADSLAIAKSNLAIATRSKELEKKVKDAKGFDAVKVAQDAMAEYDAYVNSVRKGLRGATQRMGVDSEAETRRLAMGSSFDVHVAGERTRADMETVKSFLEFTSRDIIENHRNDIVVEGDLKSAEREYRSFGIRMGMSPAKIDEDVAAMRSGARADVVEAFIASSDIAGAKDVLERTGDEIFPKARAALEDKLKAAERNSDARSKADELVSLAIGRIYTSEEFTGVRKAPTVWDINDELREIPDEAMREKVRSMVISDLAAYREGVEEKERANYDAAFASVQASGNYADINDAVEASLTSQQKQNLQDYCRKRAAGAIATDPVRYDGLKDLAAFDPMRFLKLHIPNYVADLDSGDLKYFMDLQTRMLSKDEKAEKENQDYRTISTAISDAVASSGVSMSKRKTAMFHERMAEELKRIKDPKPEDAERIAKRLLSTVIYEHGSIWHSRRRFWELGDDETVRAVDLAAIPPDEVDRIRAELTERWGRVPTDTEIQQDYTNMMTLMLAQRRGR